MWWHLFWAWSCVSNDAQLADELSRVQGMTIERSGNCYAVADVAGEGPARVGKVERHGEELWLRAESGGGGTAWRLVGPLAVPRIAGPGYKVWVLGERLENGGLAVRRIGVLARPAADSER